MPSGSKTVDKRSLSEVDICDLFISPAIQRAGWDPLTQIRREVTLTPGPVVVRGNIASRNRKKKKFADYVLYKEFGVPVAVVEAKDNHHSVGHGLQQALDYADILNVPCAFSSNGDAFASHNKTARPPEDIETRFPLRHSLRRISCGNDTSPSRDRGRRRAFGAPALLRRRRPARTPRYYQPNAINRTVEAIANGTDPHPACHGHRHRQDLHRFQIIWRLWKAGVSRSASCSSPTATSWSTRPRRTTSSRSARR